MRSWDGGYGVLQAKVKAGTPNWDAVEVESEELALGCADGIYEKIDWQKLGGKRPSCLQPSAIAALATSSGQLVFLTMATS